MGSDFACYASVYISLAWPDPIFAQGVYRLQYKRPREKGLEQFTATRFAYILWDIYWVIVLFFASNIPYPYDSYMTSISEKDL